MNFDILNPYICLCIYILTRGDLKGADSFLYGVNLPLKIKQIFIK